jgi:lysine 2,3-aminomutase
VGGNTETVSKAPMKGGRRRWQLIYEYLRKTPAIQDIVVSGGDTYYLDARDIWEIGKT